MKTHCICLCLTYFTKYNTLQAHPPMWLRMAVFHSYLWLSNISIYIYICTIHIYPITLSICLLNTCIHILPTINNTIIGVHVSFWISVFIFFQYMYPQRELPDLVVVSVFNCWWTSIVISTLVVPVCIPTMTLLSSLFNQELITFVHASSEAFIH